MEMLLERLLLVIYFRGTAVLPLFSKGEMFRS